MSERIPFDGAGERDAATLRHVGSLVVAVGSVLLVALRPALWTVAVAVASGLAVTFWTRQGHLQKRRASSLDGRSLELGDDELVVPTIDGDVNLAWRDVRRVEIDHDRLVVVIVASETTVEVEPSFGGLGIDALAQRIHVAHERARGRRA